MAGIQLPLVAGGRWEKRTPCAVQGRSWSCLHTVQSVGMLRLGSA
jgi:hypothetical protein